MNELIFLIHSTLIAFSALGAAYIGKEALTAFVAITCIVANLFVIKQITLFGLHVTATDAFIIGGVLALNLLNEYFGRESARKALWIAFGASILVAVLTHIHLRYLPNQFDISHHHFVQLLSATPRIVLASLFSYLVSQQCENTLYTFLKVRLNNNYFVIRNYLSMSVTQLIDTILFSFLGLYGIVGNIGTIILVSYGIKILAIFIISPLSWFSKWFMKRKVHEII